MAALTSAFLLLTVATLCRGVPVIEETPRWRRDVTPSYNDSELECFRQEKVLFTDGQCYSLRNRGPCPRGSWLVLSQNQVTLSDGTARSFPECQEIRCTRSLTVWWPESRECKHLRGDSNTLCPYKDNKINVNEYGEGECTCDANYARYVQDVVNGRGTAAEFVGNCYPLYRQGPCEGDKIFQTAFLDGYRTVGVCVANPCLCSSTDDPGSAFARLAPDGPCYKLGQLGGPCSTNEIFDIIFVKRQAAETLSLFKTEAERCNGNINSKTGECRQVAIIEKNKVRQLTGTDQNRRRSTG